MNDKEVSMTRSIAGQVLHTLAVWLLLLVCAGLVTRLQLADLTRHLDGLAASVGEVRQVPEPPPEQVSASN
jgi:hypothetical protein